MTGLGLSDTCGCPETRWSNDGGYSIVRRLAVLASAAVIASLAVGCSTTSKSQVNNLSSVSLSALAPATITLAASAQQQFSITASGTNDSEIIWSLLDSNGNLHYSCSISNCTDVSDTSLGVITATGLYTAPSARASLLVYVNAAAAADTSVSRKSAVTVGAQPPPITLTISPASACVQTGQTADFSAQVSNGSGVTWEVNGIPGGNSTTGIGTISNSGVYTAPVNPTSVTVTAVSVQDSTKSASASVEVQTSCQISVSVSASSATVYPGQGVDFTASVSGNPSDPAVSWALSCSNCGQIAYTGQDAMTYTAPSSVSSSFPVTVTATMVSPPGNSGQAAITVVPINPQLSISVSPSGTIYATSDSNNSPHSAQLTATLSGVPGGSAYTVTWLGPTSGTSGGFCVTTDQEGSNGYDNCGDLDGDLPIDGPGTINPTSGSGPLTVTYTAPPEVAVGASGQTNLTNTVVAGECAAVLPSGTTIDDAHPYVLVTAQTIYNGSPLEAQACIPVQN